MRHVPDQERRARLARRHGVAPPARSADPETAVRAMTVLHATEPATVYLSLWARVERLDRPEVDRALYAERVLVKQLAMRRTLFVFPRDLLPAAWGSAAARVARTHRARLVKEVVASGLATDGDAWLEAVAAVTRERLANGSALSAAELREEVPGLSARVVAGAGTAHAVSTPVAPRVLTQLGLEGHVVRGPNAGHWRVSRPLWTATETWLGEAAELLPPEQGYAELVRRWLATFGPGTTDDLVWWLGSTKAAATRALADVGAVPVTLDSGSTGYLLPGDEGPVEDPGPWVALLPVLDPTVMGWRERGFYLGGRQAAVFDRNGNAGTTAWADGRVVGCWVQDPGGVVRVVLLEEVDRAARRALDLEAARLTEWLAGEVVGTVYPSPAMKDGRAQVAGA